MAKRDRDIRKFERAAERRLEAADLLFKHGYFHDAVYLGGYAIECAFKALILRRSSRREHEETLDLLTGVGKKGHDFEYLRGMLVKKGVVIRSQRNGLFIAEKLQEVASWSVSMRYEPGELDESVARVFLEAARFLVAWAKRS